MYYFTIINFIYYYLPIFEIIIIFFFLLITEDLRSAAFLFKLIL